MEMKESRWLDIPGLIATSSILAQSRCIDIGNTLKNHQLMIFDWDDAKTESNKKKHGVSFAEAATAFSGPNAIEFLDGKNSDREDRWILVGLSSRSQVLLV